MGSRGRDFGRHSFERRGIEGRAQAGLWWLATVAVAISALGLVVVHAGLSLNERAILSTLRLRAVTQARGAADYPVSFYVEGADAGWRQALRVTDPLSPGLLVPLGAMAGALWWWRWGRRWSSAPELALLLVVAPLALYAPVRLPRIAEAVVQETPPGVEIAREADAGTAPGRGWGRGADRLAGRRRPSRPGPMPGCPWPRTSRPGAGRRPWARTRTPSPTAC